MAKASMVQDSDSQFERDRSTPGGGGGGGGADGGQARIGGGNWAGGGGNGDSVPAEQLESVWGLPNDQSKALKAPL